MLLILSLIQVATVCSANVLWPVVYLHLIDTSFFLCLAGVAVCEVQDCLCDECTFTLF